MTEKQLRQKVIGIMQSWLGYNETNGNHKKIIDIYNGHKPLARGYKVRYTDEWCATAVSAAFIQAGLTNIGFTECSCSKMIELYKAKGRWMERDDYTPQPGDVIMYDWEDSGRGDNTGMPNHVGLVTAINGTAITVIEGNKGQSVAYRAMNVNGRYIRGYCLPDYASKASTTETKPASIKIASAKSFDRAYAKTYTITASALNLRSGAGTDRPIIKSMPKGAKVTCYGYYTKNDATVWLYVKDQDGALGYCSKKYLK
jgi:hypothetical protein